MSNTIPLTEDAIREYLDASIQFWRSVRDSGDYGSEKSHYYIDAFQSVRQTLIGDTLKPLPLPTQSQEKNEI